MLAHFPPSHIELIHTLFVQSIIVHAESNCWLLPSAVSLLSLHFTSKASSTSRVALQCDPGDIMAALTKCSVDLEKGCRAVTKVLDRGRQVPNPSSRLQQSLSEMSACWERAEMTSSDLAFMLKFKKTKGQIPVNLEVAQATQKSAAEALADLIDSGKALKAMLPKV